MKTVMSGSENGMFPGSMGENVRRDKIELLDVGLLKDKNKLKVIDHWLRVMNWPNGWHYDLDIIWVLRYIEQLNLPKGATIIDAGAGLGITQFILASCGYNIISLDFADRQVPKFAKDIFIVEKAGSELAGYTHEYMEFMDYSRNQGFKEKKRGDLLSLFKKAVNPKRFGLNIFAVRNFFKKSLNFDYLLERMKGHRDFGKITFLRGTFNNIPLADNTVDALVSISAFEHNTYEDMPASINEFMRVAKKNSSLFITTSASEKEDWYFEPPKAWNFSKETLSEWFGVSADDITFNYREVFEGIVQSKALQKRIPLSYKLSAENGLPYGKLEEARYVPVGIVKVKN